MIPGIPVLIISSPVQTERQTETERDGRGKRDRHRETATVRETELLIETGGIGGA